MTSLFKLIALSLPLLSSVVGTKLSCEQKWTGSNWRRDNFLWKPIAEHYNGLAIVTLPRDAVKRVEIYDTNGKLVRVPPFRSRGDAGDAWVDYKCNGACYQRKYGSVYVRLVMKNGPCLSYLIARPKRRSDNQGVVHVLAN
jgi:hypothetical protein